MPIKQLSIFVSNTVGRIADITEILANANIDLRAMSVADTADYGILRIIVDNHSEAIRVLNKAGIAHSLTDVIAVVIDDKPGAFSKIMVLMANNEIQVDYTYAFISRNINEATVVLRVDDIEKAMEILKTANVKILNGEEICK